MTPKFLVLLGAGASIEAGLPSAAEVTRHLVSLAFDPTSSGIRRIGRVVTVLRDEAARLSRVSFADIDFEQVFAALVDAVERRDPISGGLTAEFLAPYLNGLDANRLLLDLLLYLRGLFLPSRSVEYLSGLLQSVRSHSGVIATLNYDLTVERWFTERKFLLTTGFVDRDWKGFSAFSDPELLKLHGSVHWSRWALSMNDRDSVLHHLIFRTDPYEPAPVSWTPQIARKCGRSSPWPNESGARSRGSSRRRRCGWCGTAASRLA